VVSRASSRRAGVPALVFGLALAAGLPAEGAAQHVDRAAVGARYASTGAAADPTGRPDVFADTARARSTRRPIAPFLIGGVLAGAVMGGLLAKSFNDSFCGDPAPGYSCSTTSVAEGAAFGAAFGLLLGGLVWVLTPPAESPPRAAR
jgi:hypothetical protein